MSISLSLCSVVPPSLPPSSQHSSSSLCKSRQLSLPSLRDAPLGEKLIFPSTQAQTNQPTTSGENKRAQKEGTAGALHSKNWASRLQSKLTRSTEGMNDDGPITPHFVAALQAVERRGISASESALSMGLGGSGDSAGVTVKGKKHTDADNAAQVRLH